MENEKLLKQILDICDDLLENKIGSDEIEDAYIHIKSDVEDILDNIKRAKVDALLKEYYNLFNKVYSYIKGLPNWKKPCDCEDVEETFYADDGDDGVVNKYCMQCGGRVE